MTGNTETNAKPHLVKINSHVFPTELGYFFVQSDLMFLYTYSLAVVIAAVFVCDIGGVTAAVRLMYELT